MLHAAQMQSVGCTWDTIKQCSSLFIWWMHLKGVFNVCVWGGVEVWKGMLIFLDIICNLSKSNEETVLWGKLTHTVFFNTYNIYSVIMDHYRPVLLAELCSWVLSWVTKFYTYILNKKSIKLHVTSILLILKWRMKHSNNESTRALPVVSKVFPLLALLHIYNFVEFLPNSWWR